MRVLLAPRLSAGGGTGHLRRCLELAQRLGGRAAFVTGLDDEEPLVECLDQWPRLSAAAGAVAAALVVADRRVTALAAYRRLAALGTVVGLDEGGPARRWMSFLIDTPLSGRQGANLASVDFLELPPRLRPAPPARIESVLVSFGGEDPARLTGAVLRALLEQRLLGPARITVVQGPRFAATRWPEGVSVLASPERLRDRLHQYDLVVTSFGLTCYEALAAGVPVLLVSPTRAHRRLARRAGLPEAGLRRPRAGALRRAFADPAALARPVEALAAARRPAAATLAEVVASLRPCRDGCPACGPAGGSRPDCAVARFADRSYFRCRRCGLLYMARLSGPQREYDHGYFFEEYARQYGRSYLEDCDSIRRLSRERLAIIERLVGPIAGLRVLDVGCAYGPFLEAARERGASPSGVEVAGEAVEHVRAALGLPCWQGPFEEFEGGAGSCEVLSMWYVIEHFAQLGQVLRNANRLLAQGGLLAFSTPNALGISGRARRRAFLEASPVDHYTIWDPHHTPRVLSRFGFRLARLRVTGHHPERFPGAARLEPGSATFAALRFASRVLRLGDTFEAYAFKVGDADA